MPFSCPVLSCCLCGVATALVSTFVHGLSCPDPVLTHPASQDFREDAFLADFIHLNERQVVEVACQPWSDSIPASPGGTHGTDKVDVHQVLKGS